MKQLLYICCILGLSACNANKQEKTDQNKTTELPAASGALNPAHGAPGHRCEIAVGAPLNSAPATSMTPTMQPTVTQQAPLTPAAVPTNNEKGQKLNPPHGQPGHKCE